jgi:EmrB/QacA subfamily drug resistance transporter
VSRHHPYFLFGLVSVAILLQSMQFSMVSVALPALIDGLDAPLRWVGWTITVYTLAQAVSMPISGRLSDQFGRRVVFVGGIAVFAAASAVCAAAPNIWVLIAGRALQGLSAGTVQPSAYGVVGDAFPTGRIRAIGILSSIGPAGSIVGPNLAGIIVDTIGWRWTFWLNVPAGTIVVLLGLFALRPGRGKDAGQRPDFLGAALLSATVTPIVVALTDLAREGAVSMHIVGAMLVLSVASGWAFVRRESTTTNPIVDLDLIKQRDFLVVNMLQFGYGATLFGAFSFLPLYASEAYGFSPSEAGALLTPRAVVVVLVGLATASLLPRVGLRLPILVGLVITSLGLAVLALGIHNPAIGGLEMGHFVYLALVVMIAGAGIGITNPPANAAAIELAPDRLATIAGLRGMFRFMGGVIATPLIVLIVERSPTRAGGLETAFLLLSCATAALMLLGWRVPESKEFRERLRK